MNNLNRCEKVISFIVEKTRIEIPGLPMVPSAQAVQLNVIGGV